MRFGTDAIAAELLEAGLVNAQDLARARQAQMQLSTSLPTALVRIGAISEAALLPVLSRMTGLSLVQDEDESFQPAAVHSACRRLAARLGWFLDHDALPWERADGRIAIAARDPLQSDLRDFVAQRAAQDENLQVEWLYAAQGTIESLRARAVDGDGAQVAANQATQLRELAEEAPVIEYVNGLFARAVDERASDLHLEPSEHGFAIRLRVDGTLRDLHAMPRSQFDAVVSRIKLIAGLDIAERRLPQDGRLSTRAGGSELDLRVSVIPSVHGESVVIRFLPKSSRRITIEKLGMEADHTSVFRHWLDQPNGIILVTGPTGSGKSTTLYAGLDCVRTGERKIVTVEDPVEYQLPGITQIQVQPEIGYTFAQALRAVLRHDPDVILVGEIRDRETASIAIQAALTGHLVLASLHTNDALGAIPRLIDMEVEGFLLAATLRGVIAQRLVRKLCHACAVPIDEAPPSAAWPEAMRYLAGRSVPLCFKKAVGCPSCGETGYRGRTAIYEFLPVGRELQRLIAQHSKGAGAAGWTRYLQRSLLLDGLLKAGAGVTSHDEVLRVAGLDGDTA